jgi:hypothetical protein
MLPKWIKITTYYRDSWHSKKHPLNRPPDSWPRCVLGAISSLPSVTYLLTHNCGLLTSFVGIYPGPRVSSELKSHPEDLGIGKALTKPIYSRSL